MVKSLLCWIPEVATYLWFSGWEMSMLCTLILFDLLMDGGEQ